MVYIRRLRSFAAVFTFIHQKNKVMKKKIISACKLFTLLLVDLLLWSLNSLFGIYVILRGLICCLMHPKRYYKVFRFELNTIVNALKLVEDGEQD